jgi:hypothetical protein
VGLQVTEEAKVDLTQGRVEGEEYLREHGAICLVLAGIYGDERQPSSWLLRGTHHHIPHIPHNTHTLTQ